MHGESAELSREKRRGRARYSDEEKAGALTILAVNNGNVKRTARSLGIPRATLTAWARGRGTHAGVTQLCHLKKDSLADRFEEVIRKMLAALPSKIEDAPLLDLVKGVGILVDKMLLLRNCPTKIETNADGTLKGFR